MSFEGDITLAVAHQIIGIAIGAGSATHETGRRDSAPPKNAKTFLADKKPLTDVEKIACLAFYLTNFEATSRFKGSDIERVKTDAATHISNLARAIDNATRQSKFLAKAGEGTKQITSLGESIVNALPNRDAVTAALNDEPSRRRKRARKKKL